MEGTGPATVRGFFYWVQENFCDVISHLFAFFGDLECCRDVSPTMLCQSIFLQVFILLSIFELK
jgi:hypothetical protein